MVEGQTQNGWGISQAPCLWLAAMCPKHDHISLCVCAKPLQLLVLQVVADRSLLARLVLLREELRSLAEQQSAEGFWRTNSAANVIDSHQPPASSSASASQAAGGGDSSDGMAFFAFHRSNLPARCAAFLKNLLNVQDRNARLGLLNKVRAHVRLERVGGSKLGTLLMKVSPGRCSI